MDNPRLDDSTWLGEFRVERGRDLVIGPDGRSKISPKCMNVLCALMSRPAMVVSKQEILDRVWPGLFVSENLVSHAVYELRKVFGDSASEPTYIETVPKRGYRLLRTPTSRLETPGGLEPSKPWSSQAERENRPATVDETSAVPDSSAQATLRDLANWPWLVAAGIVLLSAVLSAFWLGTLWCNGH